MKRKDCFFGLHFDYHAAEHMKDVGKEINPDVIERIVTEVKPDFVQCDTKGHPGYTSYPTKVGYTAPGLAKDILREWRTVTKKHNILLFSHYSGVWDQKAMKEHPEWAVIDKNGKVTDKASVFGEYADKLLIPQLKELAWAYEMDGAWIDGECWAHTMDYSSMAKSAWNGREEEYTIDNPAVREFMRNGFFDYVNHYREEVKKVAPNFEITSNWLNTEWVPDNICCTDFISGDLTPTNCIDRARFGARLIQSFGRHWDLMAWGIGFPVHYVKGSVQLCQEASVIISLGGGFQLYNLQSPQKTLMDEWAIGEWAKTAQFVRQHQPYCQDNEIIPDVGILYSKDAYYKSLGSQLFFSETGYNMELSGILTAFCDAGRSVSVILAERAMEIDFSAYKTIVVTDLGCMEASAKEKLLEYVNAGGEAVFCGVNTVELFAEELGLSLANPISTICRLAGDDYEQEIRRPYVKIVNREYVDAIQMHECSVEGDINCMSPPPAIRVCEETIPAFMTLQMGKGVAAVMPLNIGELYNSERTYVLKRFFRACLSKLREGKVSHNKPSQADIVIAEKDGKDYIHLINLLGDHRAANVRTFDSIPPIYGIEVRYLTERQPKEVIDCETGKTIDFSYQDGKLTVSTNMEIYKILQIRY